MKKKVFSLLLAGALLTTPALAAQVEETVPAIAPSGLALDGDILYVADSYQRSIWTVTDGEAERLAGAAALTDQWGQPVGGYRDGPFDQALFSEPWAIVPYLDGFLVSDAGSHTLRYLDLEEEQVYTAAGTGEAGYENGLGIKASFDTPAGLAVAEDGTVYIADSGNHVIRAMDPEGNVTTYAGSTEGSALGNSLKTIRFSSPTGLCYADGVLYVADSGNHRVVALSGNTVALVAGAELFSEWADQGGYWNDTADRACFSSPQGLALGEDGTLYIADTGNGAVRAVKNGVVTTLLAGENEASYPVAPRGLLAAGDTLYVGDVFARVLLTCEAAAEPPAFSDVAQEAWYAQAVGAVVSNGLFQGLEDGVFAPDETMTRGMVLTVLARYDGVDTTQGSSWYEAGRQWALEQGVSDGTGLEDPVTREQLAALLFRYAGGEAGRTELTRFADGGAVSDWAADAMVWAVEHNLLEGSGGCLYPQRTATRAEVAAILARFGAQNAGGALSAEES